MPALNQTLAWDWASCWAARQSDEVVATVITPWTPAATASARTWGTRPANSLDVRWQWVSNKGKLVSYQLSVVSYQRSHAGCLEIGIRPATWQLSTDN